MRFQAPLRALPPTSPRLAPAGLDKTLVRFLGAALALGAPVAVALSPIASLGAVEPAAAAVKLAYPETNRTGVIDDFFGIAVPDPYRWLEDTDSPAVATWVEAQNKVTFSYLAAIPYRAQVKDRLAQLYNYPRYSIPTRRDAWYFFAKNDGLQNQDVRYIQRGLDGNPETLLDPNKLSADGATRLGAFSPSRTGKYVGYGISQGGSDWNDVHVIESATKQTLVDHLQWVRSSGLSWRGDEGFFYSRYPAPEKGKELTTKNEFHTVHYHRVGTPQSEDQLIYEDKEHPQRFHSVRVTEDQPFAILFVSEPGKGKKGNAISWCNLSKTSTTFAPIVGDIGDDSYRVIDAVDGGFLIETNHAAPNGKVVLYNPKTQAWKDVLPEKPESLEIATTAGGKLFATYLKDVTTRAYVYSLDGRLENEIEMPAFGTADGFGGRRDDTHVFYSFTSFTIPPTIYKYDIAAKKSTVYRTSDVPGFVPTNYEVKQVFYGSKDGTRVPMFLVHKKGIKLDGQNPTLLHGYGGFNISTKPEFDSLRLALLEQGVVYASANIRGGGEYGERWHQAGTKLKKQNVFDDFVAAAEFLIAHRITSPRRLAIHGASNGGLLVGAVANQRPDLFKCVVQRAGVMDMLRFQKFTIGWNWISDYGSSENPEEFKALYAYSPIHNVKPGVKYPATLITTADHDDRVVPAHSFKYAAALQAGQGGDDPILIRIDTRSGHRASSTTKLLEQVADVYSFVFSALGVNPRW